MEPIIALINQFIVNYGLSYTLIAIAGVIILGILKYTNCFSKLEETPRHIIYLIISIGLSIAGSAIYMLITQTWDWNAIIYMSSAVFGLNQTCYSLYCALPFKILVKKLLEWFGGLIKE